MILTSGRPCGIVSVSLYSLMLMSLKELSSTSFESSLIVKYWKNLSCPDSLSDTTAVFWLLVCAFTTTCSTPLGLRTRFISARDFLTSSTVSKWSNDVFDHMPSREASSNGRLSMLPSTKVISGNLCLATPSSPLDKSRPITLSTALSLRSAESRPAPQPASKLLHLGLVAQQRN